MAKNLKTGPFLSHSPEWVGGYTAWLPDRKLPKHVHRVGYTLKDLERRGYLEEGKLKHFYEETLLEDFAWRLMWVDENKNEPDAESIDEAIGRSEGVLVFVHGWDASGEIWEELPAMALQANPKLIVLVPDINGFGGSPFSTGTPPIEKCAPPAVMQSLQLWFEMLSLRSEPSVKQVKPVIFIGHSMGAATLFFLDESRWRMGEVGRVAAAPALLMNDKQRQNLYRTLGASIQLTGLAEVIDRITENVIAPRVIEVFAGGSSDRVQAEHRRIFRNTHEGVISRTFAAMGMLEADFPESEWEHCIVYLAHKDRLVGIEPTLELLDELGISPEHIRVALGDHYFFSVGKNAERHRRNRDLFLKDIMKMHKRLFEAGK